MAVPDIRRLALEGFALHLPIDNGELPRVEEISSWVSTLRRHQLPTDTLWVSHVSDAELATLHRRHPETRFRPRIGTALWLGDRDSYRARGTVLAVHPTRRGVRFGYRQRKAPGDGHLLIIGGGTSHGVALSAPHGRSPGSPRASSSPPRAPWRPVDGPCRPSTWPGSGAGSPSRPTCRCPWSGSRRESLRRSSATRSTSTSG